MNILPKRQQQIRRCGVSISATETRFGSRTVVASQHTNRVMKPTFNRKNSFHDSNSSFSSELGGPFSIPKSPFGISTAYCQSGQTMDYIKPIEVVNAMLV